LNIAPKPYGIVDLLSALWELDKSVFKLMNLAGTSTILDILMVSFTALGLPYVLGMLSVPLWMRAKKEQAIDLVVLIVIVSVSVELIKLVVRRERPFDVLDEVNGVSFGGFSKASDPSFPSAHAARAFAVAVLLTHGRSRGQASAAIGVAAMIGISRIYLGVHWPSDVLAGALLGVGIAFLVVKLGNMPGFYHRCRSRAVRVIDQALARTRGSHRESNLPLPLRNCSRIYSCHYNAIQTTNRMAEIYAIPHRLVQPLYP
jgi:undecaprenyl-diphosphatase